MTKASTLHLIDRLQFPWLTASMGLYFANVGMLLASCSDVVIFGQADILTTLPYQVSHKDHHCAGTSCPLSASSRAFYP